MLPGGTDVRPGFWRPTRGDPALVTSLAVPGKPAPRVVSYATTADSELVSADHRTHICRKFDVAGRAEAVVIAGQAGLLGGERASVADLVAEPSADDVSDLDVVGTAEQELAGVEAVDAACASVDCVELILAE